MCLFLQQLYKKKQKKKKIQFPSVDAYNPIVFVLRSFFFFYYFFEIYLFSFFRFQVYIYMNIRKIAHLI